MSDQFQKLVIQGLQLILSVVYAEHKRRLGARIPLGLDAIVMGWMKESDEYLKPKKEEIAS